MKNDSIYDAIDSLTPTKEIKQDILDHVLSASPTQKIHHGHTWQKVAIFLLVIGACSALSVTAYAYNFLGIQTLLIQHEDTIITHDFSSAEPDAISSAEPDGNGDAETITEMYVPTQIKQTYNLICVQGYPDSKEFKASKEWMDFESNYDTDYAIVSKLGNENNEYTLAYPEYYCYSKEMADKIKEITTKYDLKLHQNYFDLSSNEDLYNAAKTGNFIKDVHISTSSSYCYDDGTFHFDSDFVLDDLPLVGFQFDRAAKEVFSQTCLNIGDPDTYQETPFTTVDGSTVTLALSDDQALIIYDAPASFIVINVLEGRNFGLTMQHMQTMANMFDFTLIP